MFFFEVKLRAGLNVDGEKRYIKANKNSCVTLMEKHRVGEETTNMMVSMFKNVILTDIMHTREKKLCRLLCDGRVEISCQFT